MAPRRVVLYAWLVAALLAPVVAVLAGKPVQHTVGGGAAGQAVRLETIVETVKPVAELKLGGRRVAVEDPVTTLLLWVLAEASGARCLGCQRVPCGNLTLLAAGSGGVWLAPASVSWNASGVSLRGAMTAPFHAKLHLVGIFVYNGTGFEAVAYTLGNWSVADGSSIVYEVYLNTSGTSIDPEGLASLLRSALACSLGSGSTTVTIADVNVTVRPVAYTMNTSVTETNETIVTPVGSVTITASRLGACILAYPFATSSYWRVVSEADGVAWIDRSGYVNGTTVVVYKVAYPCVEARVYS